LSRVYSRPDTRRAVTPSPPIMSVEGGDPVTAVLQQSVVVRRTADLGA